MAAQQRWRVPADPDGFRRCGSDPPGTRRVPTPGCRRIPAGRAGRQQRPTATRRTTHRHRTIPHPHRGRRHPRQRPPPRPLLRHLAGPTPPAGDRGTRRRTYTHHARTNINAAIDLLDWLADHETTLADTGQADIGTYLAGQPPSRYRVRDFLQWAAATGHTGPVTIATPGRNPGPATGHDQRWAQIARLLHDDTIELTDRVAGALLLLYGQHLARIVAITHDQIKTQGPQLFLRLGTDDLHIPEPLAELIATLARDGRPYTGVGTPSTTRWLFPGLQPGRPLTAARLGDRLRKLGIRAQPGRRAALTHLAAQLPAASSPTYSASTPPPPSTGSTTPAATGTATPPNSPTTPVTNPDECLA
nr:hypothetical protein [Mycobacterium sp.]